MAQEKELGDRQELDKNKPKTQQTLNLVPLCSSLGPGFSEMWAPEGLGSPIRIALLLAILSASLLRWFCSLLKVFFSRKYKFLLSQSIFSLHWSFGFTFIGSHNDLLGPTAWPFKTSFKIWWKLPWSYNSCILLAQKASTTWMTERPTWSSRNI